MAGAGRAGTGAARSEGPDPRGLRRRRHHRRPAGQAAGRARGHHREYGQGRPGEELGADVVVDYKKQAFETVLHGYDVVLDTLGGETLEKSLKVLKPGGKVISVAGPPDPAFARELGANVILRLAMSALSFRTRRRAKRRNVTYSFLFMKASGDQLRELTPLIDAGKIRPVVDRVFLFDQTREAMEYVEKGRAKAARSSSR